METRCVQHSTSSWRLSLSMNSITLGVIFVRQSRLEPESILWLFYSVEGVHKRMYYGDEHAPEQEAEKAQDRGRERIHELETQVILLYSFSLLVSFHLSRLLAERQFHRHEKIYPSDFDPSVMTCGNRVKH